MIDASNLKAPGWQKIVQELAGGGGAGDDRAYLDKLLRVMAQAAAARQAVLFIPMPAESGETQMKPLGVFPPPVALSGGGAAAPSLPPEMAGAAVMNPEESRRAAFACLESGQSRIFSLSQTGDALYDGSTPSGYIVAIALTADAGAGGVPARPSAVITLLLESRSRAAVQSTVAMAEVLAGYVHVHTARQELSRVQRASLALDAATRLLGAINNAPSFQGACIQLVNQAARQFGADRAAIGWAEGSGERITVKALSDTEQFDRRLAMVQRLQAAMEECLDQAQPVMHPPPEASQDVLLHQAITHAHRQLASADPGLKVVSAPLRAGDAVVGVLTLESKGEGAIDVAQVELIQSCLDLLAPVLKVRRNDDRNLALRAKDSVVRGAAWLVGPKHAAWKAAAILLLIGLVFVSVYRTTYRVGATATVQPRIKRIISAPFEGVLSRLTDGIVPGAVVRAGDLLAELDANELMLQAAEAESRMNQALSQMAQAMSEQRTNEAQKAQAQADAARAQMDLYRSRIERSRIVAPIDGVVISGDLRDKVGAAAKTGDELFQIAPLGEMEVVVRIDERDIALVREALERAERGGTAARGAIALRAAPGREFAFTVLSIVPLAEAAEGRNEFAVRGRLESPAAWMRPGMEGYAKVETESASLLWIGTRRIVDTVRLWLW